MTQIGLGWTDTRCERLRILWPEYSASICAVDLGVTRSAIIGKAHRMGLAGKKKVNAVRKEMGPRPKRTRPMQRRPAFNPDTELTDLPFDQSPDAMTIAGLTENTCRWPLGVPAHDMLYCGSETGGFGAYCGRHHWLAHKPAGRRY